MELISFLNYDKDCLGIIVQLPLPEKFKEYQSQILSAISPTKDIDGLGGVLTGLTEIGRIDFTPATPKAVLTLLKHYKLDNFKGKTVAILGQSNIVGKPLAIELINQGATVYTCNADTPQAQIKTITKMADYIISCTGKVHLIDDSYIRDDKSQILIDVGYGHIDGKPVGDVNIPSIENKVASYTPVPGGIGPLTVACLFDNVFILEKNKEILKQYKL